MISVSRSRVTPFMYAARARSMKSSASALSVGLSIGQFEVERNSDAVGDVVLQCEQIADIAVELLRPQMCIRLGVDQLSVDAHFAARPPDASLEHIADAQLAADLLGVDP